MSTSTKETISLSEIFLIYKVHRKIFWLTVLMVFFLGMSVDALTSQTYKSVLLLDIVRSQKVSQSQEYDYDNYYRLEADKQFAETVAAWLKSPRLVEDIFQSASLASNMSLRDKERYFAVSRISPQSLRVTYNVINPTIANILAENIIKQINQRALGLNKEFQGYWFEVKGEKPVSESNKKPLGVLVIFLVGLGLFLATITVALKYYFSGNNN